MSSAIKDELFRTINRLNAERVAARRIVMEILQRPEVWDEEIQASWRTAGVASELTSVAAGLLEQNPERSRELAQLAVAVSGSLAADAYPEVVLAQVEGDAWKELGTAHRYLSQFGAAMRAYDAADRAYQRNGALAHGCARIGLARAVVLRDEMRFDEALRAIEESIALLADFGDKPRLLQAELLRGVILYSQGLLAESRTVYRSVLEQLQQTEDLHTLACTYVNLGNVEADLHQPDAAALAFQQARGLFAGLEMVSEVVRTDWGLARLLLATGEFARASVLLERVRIEFLRLAMPEEAGLSGLDLIEVAIAANEYERARSLSEQVMAEFVAAGLDARAQTALAYLSESLRQTPRRSSVVQVRTYLERFKANPSLLFAPAPHD